MEVWCNVRSGREEREPREHSGNPLNTVCDNEPDAGSKMKLLYGRNTERWENARVRGRRKIEGLVRDSYKAQKVGALSSQTNAVGVE